MCALLAAIILTPWYANSQDASLAPALMVVLMDAITLDGSEAARALLPLSLAIILAFFVALIALYINKKIRKSTNINKL